VYASVIDVIGARTFGPAAHRSCGGLVAPALT